MRCATTISTGSQQTFAKLAELRLAREACYRVGYVMREAADRMAAGTGKRPFLCQFCYRFHLARCVPHLVPGAGR